MMARLFAKVDIDVVKYKNSNSNSNKNLNDMNNDNDMNDSQLINESSLINEVINDVKHKTANVRDNQFKTKLNHLFIACLFHFAHSSSTKYFRIYNKRIYKLLANRFVVDDILLKVWMVHDLKIISLHYRIIQKIQKK